MYCFGRFTLDPATRRLSTDGVPVSLGALDFRLLLVLIESAGVVVTKDDLMSCAWGRAVEEVIQLHRIGAQLSEDQAMSIASMR